MQQTLSVPFILSHFKTLEMSELQCSWDVTARGDALVIEEQEPGNTQGVQPGFDAAPVLAWEGKVWSGAGPGEGLGAVLEADLRAGSGDTTPQGCPSPAWGGTSRTPTGATVPGAVTSECCAPPWASQQGSVPPGTTMLGFYGVALDLGWVFGAASSTSLHDLLGTAALLLLLFLPMHQELFPGLVDCVNTHEHDPKANPELHFLTDSMPATLCRQTCAALCDEHKAMTLQARGNEYFITMTFQPPTTKIINDCLMAPTGLGL